MSSRRVSVALAVAVVLNTIQARGADRPDVIPFKLIQGFAIVAQGGIGVVNNLNFLVDTGAVPSVVSEKVASQIGVTGLPGTLALLHKAIEAPYVVISDVRLGPIRAASLPMVVVDLRRLEDLLGTRIDGIIGLDLLAKQSLTIDYKHKKITRGLSRRRLHVISAEIDSFAGAPYWVLPISLSGRPFRVLLDTGADDLALFSGHTPKEILELRRSPRVVAGLTGETTIQELQPQPLIIGDMLFDKQLALVLQEPLGELRDVDGLLGPTAVRISYIELDWENKRLRWEAQQ